MKSIKCELCGSNDLKKIDGEYVCQYCGAKYTLEEAKKMMVEIEGTVKIDSSSQVSNLENLAERAIKDEAYKKANDYYGKLLELDSDNWKYIYYKGLCEARIGDLPAVVSGCKNAFSAMNRNNVKVDDVNKLYRKMANDINQLAFFNAQSTQKGLNVSTSTNESITSSWNILRNCIYIEDYASSLIKNNVDKSQEDKNLYLAITKNIVVFCEELGKPRKYLSGRNQYGPIYNTMNISTDLRNKYFAIYNNYKNEIARYDPTFVNSYSKKSSGLSNGAIVAIILVVLGILFCGFFGIFGGNTSKTKSSSTSRKVNSSSVTENKEKYYSIGDTISTKNWEITIESAEFKKRVDPPVKNVYYNYYEADKDKIYLCVILNCKNIATSNKSASNAASVDVKYNDKYTYSSSEHVPDKTLGFSYTSLTSVEPLTSQQIYYLVEMPESISKESDTPVMIEITTDWNTYKIKYR